MRAIIYVHGKGGSHLEAQQYRESCKGFDIVGVEYDNYLPWTVREQIKAIYDGLKDRYDEIYLIANSIGAYFSMIALQGVCLRKALFISPILDMERLILDMLSWANTDEKELRERGEIATDFGETLSWEYLDFVRSNPVAWSTPTEILYPENDNLTSRGTVENFTANNNANLTVMMGAEHWFCTDEQTMFLTKWMKKAIGS